MAAVRSAFKPEFINRLDDVIVFDALQPDELVSIVDIQLEQLPKRLAQRRLILEVSLPAKQWLAERGFDPLYGARPLRRLIQQAIGDQLARLLLAGDVHDGDVVPVNVSVGRLTRLIPVRRRSTTMSRLVTLHTPSAETRYLLAVAVCEGSDRRSRNVI